MFQFTLQSVLDYRLNLDEKALHEFSAIKRYLGEQKNVLRSLINERESLINDLRNLRQTPLPAEYIAAMLRYVETIREREEKQKKTIEQIEEQVEKKRKDLVEAVKNRKVMENLKDRQAEEYKKNMNDTERKNMDEISILKFGRREQ